MKKSIFCVLSVAAVMGAVLTSTAASAAVKANPPAGGDPDTTVTFTVTSGLLTMTAPGAVNLTPTSPDTGLPGTSVHGTMGATTVTDDRALLGAVWTATAAESDFTTGTTPTADQTIPAADATYDPGTFTTTGHFLSGPTGTSITLSNAPQTVVTATADGDNTASWDAALAVAIPADAVLGGYTGTLTQSVS